MSKASIFIFHDSLLKVITWTYGVPFFIIVFKAGCLSPLTIIGKFISNSNVSVSTIPGISIFPLISNVSAEDSASEFLTFLPIAFTLPFLSKIKEPYSSIFCEGSIIRAFIKIFSLI